MCVQPWIGVSEEQRLLWRGVWSDRFSDRGDPQCVRGNVLHNHLDGPLCCACRALRQQHNNRHPSATVGRYAALWWLYVRSTSVTGQMCLLYISVLRWKGLVVTGLLADM
jgi:hypothetical protein